MSKDTVRCSQKGGAEYKKNVGSKMDWIWRLIDCEAWEHEGDLWIELLTGNIDAINWMRSNRSKPFSNDVVHH